MAEIPSSDQRVVIDRLEKHGVIPVVELASLDQASPLLEALSAGGLPAVEITLRTAAGLLAIAEARRAYPNALVGAGTVRSVDDAQRAIDQGAQFIVSPGIIPEVLELCRSLAVPAFPGVCTPTEVQAALRAGAALVKFFPAEAMGGVAFLQALAGPFPDVRFVPTGGVTASNLRNYLELPTVVACGGTWLARPSVLAAGRWDEIEQLARQASSIVAEVRRGV
jgi:2-dehydro-3-deoxyphosphogluconate aldolase/(4S)-4-hydroxy-2-oxoglutarate aldolase